MTEEMVGREEVTTTIASGAIEARPSNPLNVPGADHCTQTTTKTTADRSAEDTRNLSLSKYGSNYLGSQSPYVHPITHGPALVLCANGIVATEENR